MGEIGGLRAYARHRGVTLKAVQKRRDAGAITVGEDGKIDFEQADGEWTASTSRNGHRHGHRPGTLVEAQRRLALARARLARLEYRKRRGELVDAGKVRQSAFTTGRRVRDALLGVPDRVVPMLVPPGEHHRAHALLRDEIVRALCELSGTEAKEAGRDERER